MSWQISEFDVDSLIRKNLKNSLKIELSQKQEYDYVVVKIKLTYEGIDIDEAEITICTR